MYESSCVPCTHILHYLLTSASTAGCTTHSATVFDLTYRSGYVVLVSYFWFIISLFKYYCVAILAVQQTFYGFDHSYSLVYTKYLATELFSYGNISLSDALFSAPNSL